MKFFLILIFLLNLISSQVTLKEIYTSIIRKIPRRDFISTKPNQQQFNEWSRVIEQMTKLKEKEDCFKIRLENLKEIYKIQLVEEKYCIIYEENEIVKGWGSYFSKFNVDQDKLHLQIPHPITDYTENQGFYLFERVNRITSYLLSGTTRNAEERRSPCFENYFLLDMSHSNESFFIETTKVISKQNENNESSNHVIQLHGMAETTCLEDVFIANGLPSTYKPTIERDKFLLNFIEKVKENSNFVISHVGRNSTCKLLGTLNTQGRILNQNGNINSCTSRNIISKDKFIHIEQKRNIRESLLIWENIFNKI
jgi:hypothetical protein